ncbi:putative B3 domain-containing protein REM15 [Silene latifolia]|uniref:putative B3 domain-containing protein REM15 n=1 Tax=Silene latifolia TaxID=37657 RepID=UPI003D784633
MNIYNSWASTITLRFWLRWFIYQSHRHVSKKYHSSFFQPFVEHKNSINLRIPPPFVKKFRNIPYKISLKNTNGLVWPAKLGYIGDHLHITSGWKEFVKEHTLKSGDFVVFHYVPDSTFLVTTFDSDGCSKVAPLVKKKRRTIARPNFEFVRTIKTTHLKSFVTFPSWMIKSCAIELPQRVKLCFEEGVSKKIWLRKTGDRTVLGYAGMPQFWEMNNVQIGDKLQFQIILGEWNTIKKIIVRRVP